MGIDSMPVGREMDLLIINTIPGLFPKSRKGGNSTFTYQIERLKDGPIDIFDGGSSMVEAEDGEPHIIWVRNDGAKGIKKPVPCYSTNIADAFKIVDNWDSGNGTFELNCAKTGNKINWHCQFGNYPAADAETAPLAICRARLKAMGVNEC